MTVEHMEKNIYQTPKWEIQLRLRQKRIRYLVTIYQGRNCTRAKWVESQYWRYFGNAIKLSDQEERNDIKHIFRKSIHKLNFSNNRASRPESYSYFNK